MLRKIFTIYKVDKEDDNKGDSVVETGVGEGSMQCP
jgi:hypothetical protein